MPGVALGEVVAGCRIEDVAGHGGMGVVYRATQLRLNRTVAFKAMAAELALNPAYRERFQREAQLAASIEHPNVIPVYEAGELDAKELYLVMRWVEGTDLRKLLNREQQLAPAAAVRFLAPVALALNAAHARGLVHRDVKPANVLIAQGSSDQIDHVYLTDFGIARGPEDVGGLTQTGTFVGTLAYAAPERIEGDRGAPASDIYALGCVLFEALAGRPPFNRETELSTMNAHLHDPIPSLRAEVPDAPIEFDEVVHIALAKDPADRFATAGEMATALDDALVGRRVTRRAHPTDADTTAAGTTVTATMADHGVAGAETVLDAGPRTAARRPSRNLAIGAVALVLGGVIALVIALAGGGGTPSRSTTTGTTTAGAVPGAPHVGVAELGPVPSTPGAVALLGPDAAVTQPDRAAVVILHRSGQPAATIPVGADPSALAVDRSGRLWVADAGAGAVQVIDPATNKTIARIAIGKNPAAIAFGGGSAWVADRGSDTVRAIDLKTLKPSGAPIPTGGRGPGALTYDQTGTLWVVNQDNSEVTAIRAGHASAPHYIGGASSITADGSGDVWVGTTSGTVVRLTGSGQVTGQPIALHSGAAIVALVGTDLWVLSHDDATLSLIPTSGAGAGSVVSRTSMSPAEQPTAMSCAQHRCVVADVPTRQIVAANF